MRLRAKIGLGIVVGWGMVLSAALGYFMIRVTELNSVLEHQEVILLRQSEILSVDMVLLRAIVQKIQSMEQNNVVMPEAETLQLNLDSHIVEKTMDYRESNHE